MEQSPKEKIFHRNLQRIFKNPAMCTSSQFCNVSAPKSGNLFVLFKNLIDIIIKTWKLFCLNVLHPMNFNTIQYYLNLVIKVTHFLVNPTSSSPEALWKAEEPKKRISLITKQLIQTEEFFFHLLGKQFLYLSFHTWPNPIHQDSTIHQNSKTGLWDNPRKSFVNNQFPFRPHPRYHNHYHLS